MGINSTDGTRSKQLAVKTSAPDVSYDVDGAFTKSVKASPSSITRKNKPRFATKEAAPDTEVFVPGIADSAKGVDPMMSKTTPRFVTKEAIQDSFEPAPGMFDSPQNAKPGVMERAGTPGGANRSKWLTTKDQEAAPASAEAPAGAFDTALSVPRQSALMTQASPRFKTKQAVPDSSAPMGGAFNMPTRPSPITMQATPRFGKKYAATQMNGEPGV